MTTAPLRLCRRTGCPGLTRDRDGYCDKCKGYAAQQVRPRYGKKHTEQFYGTARWQRFRNWYKAQHPLCEDCLEAGKTVATELVDHVVELRDGGDSLNSDNARSLCRRCHAAKTAAEKRKRKYLKDTGGIARSYRDKQYTAIHSDFYFPSLEKFEVTQCQHIKNQQK